MNVNVNLEDGKFGWSNNPNYKEWWGSIRNTNANMQENVTEDIYNEIDVLIHNMAIERTGLQKHSSIVPPLFDISIIIL